MTQTIEKIVEPEKKSLTAEEFISRSRPKMKTVNIPELGGDVVIRAVTLTERDEIKSASTDTRSGKINESTFIAITVVKGLVEPKLAPAHIAELQQSNFGILSALAQKIWGLSGVAEEAKNA